MPYISQEARKEIDNVIDELAIRIIKISQAEENAYAGILNYTCTTLAMSILNKRFGKLRYSHIALITGVFKNIADEFYRRVGVPYEDKQIAKSGDVPLYEQYGK